MAMSECPTTGLILPTRFIDEKVSLKKVIDEWVDKAVLSHQHLKENYFLTFHAKFNKFNDQEFQVDAPKITYKLPPFLSNSIVFWVSNKRGICELLWVVPAKKQGQKLSVEFNKKGVAYLQAKGAMPS
jgi:hypothetical protein